MQIGNIKVYGVIYKITNKANGKVYIGQTTRGFNKRYGKGNLPIERVYSYYDSKKNKNYGFNKHLYYSIEKYGYDKFEVIEIFDIAWSKQELNIKEEAYIQIYNCIENGYNEKSGGAYGKHSLKTKDKIRDKALKRLKNKENHPMYGKKFSDASREIMSKSQKEYFKTHKNHRYGKTHTEEAKIKMSKAHKGKKLTEEHKNNISLATKGDKNPASRSVYVYSLENKYIAKFNTVNECGAWLIENNYFKTSSNNPLPVMRTLISRNIKQNKPFAGFILSYVDKQAT